MQREDDEKKAYDILSLRTASLVNSRFSDKRYMVVLSVFLILPFAGPLILYFYRPDSDLGQIMAVLGWPGLFLLAGLFLSGFDQPKITDDELGENFVKLKWKAHNLRVGWLFFLVVFESLSAMCIFGRESGMPMAYFLIPTGLYVVYAILCVWWLNCLKRMLQKGK